MPLVLVGLSHHSASIDIRERLSCSEPDLPIALAALSARPDVCEVILLSTCNRTEVYARLSSPDAPTAYALLTRRLCEFYRMTEAVLTPHLYYKSEQEAATHLLRVAGGLDSLVLGEAQILGQVKTALQAGRKAGTVGAVLSKLFEHAIVSGKRVRTETELGRGGFSIGHAAVKLASSIFTLTHAGVLILGAGKMSELTARHLVNAGVKFVVVANRTYEKAAAMAARLGGRAIHYDLFEEELIKADIVISSTAAPHPILRRDTLAPLLRRRRGKSLFLIDIAVPRDIDPDVNELDNVFLYNIDHLEAVVADEAQERTQYVEQADAITAEEAANFLVWYRARQAAPVISDLREHLNRVADNRLTILRTRLGSVSERDWKLIETQFRALMDEVVREPILRLKRAAGDDGMEDGARAAYDLLTATREIFGLDATTDQERGDDRGAPTQAPVARGGELPASASIANSGAASITAFTTNGGVASPTAAAANGGALPSSAHAVGNGAEGSAGAHEEADLRGREPAQEGKK